jgi:dsRNA-specific ribonuclease
MFEALFGTILEDSSLLECFKFLDRMYKPFILYTYKYIDDIKYSPVTELQEMCIVQYGKPAIFISETVKEGILVKIINKDEEEIANAITWNEEKNKDIAAIKGIEVLKAINNK